MSVLSDDLYMFDNFSHCFRSPWAVPGGDGCGGFWGDRPSAQVTPPSTKIRKRCTHQRRKECIEGIAIQIW